MDLQRRVRPSRDAEEARRAKLLADAPRFDEARTARRLTPAGALASTFSASGKKDDRRRDRRRVDGTAFAFHPDDILAYAFETCVVDEQGAFERASPEDGGARDLAGADAFAPFAPALVALVGASQPAALPDRRRLKEMIHAFDGRNADGHETTDRASMRPTRPPARPTRTIPIPIPIPTTTTTRKRLSAAYRARRFGKSRSAASPFRVLPEPLRASDVDSRALRHDVSRDNTPLDAIDHAIDHDHATKTKRVIDKTLVDEARCAAARLPPIVAAAAKRDTRKSTSF